MIEQALCVIADIILSGIFCAIAMLGFYAAWYILGDFIDGIKRIYSKITTRNA